MSQTIEFKNHQDLKVAELKFDDDPPNLNVFRTASGFKLSMPATLSLIISGQNDPKPHISNLHGVIFAAGRSGSAIEIGRLENDAWYSGGWANNPGGLSPNGACMTWRGSLTELMVFEELREGRRPEFEIQVRGELCYLMPSEHSRLQSRSHPQQLYGQTKLSYSTDTWIRELRKIRVLETVLVEVPLPSEPPDLWDGVWRNLVEARDAFERGGSTGWNACVLSVRQALEKWKTVEDEDTGPDDSRQRSTRQRLNNLRRALHQCSHAWIHDHQECSRNDALLMLSTLSALLAERKP